MLNHHVELINSMREANAAASNMAAASNAIDEVMALIQERICANQDAMNARHHAIVEMMEDDRAKFLAESDKMNSDIDELRALLRGESECKEPQEKQLAGIADDGRPVYHTHSIDETLAGVTFDPKCDEKTIATMTKGIINVPG